MIAVVCAFVMLAAGCGSAGNPGGQTLPGESATADSDPPGSSTPEPEAGLDAQPSATGAFRDATESAPTLIPATESAPVDLPEKEPVVRPPESAKEVQVAPEQAASTTTQPATTTQTATTTAPASTTTTPPTPTTAPASTTTTPPTPTTTTVPEAGAYREPTVTLDNGWVVYGPDYVPPVHPDTRPPSWVRATDDGRSRPDDVPRRSEEAQAWLDWCGVDWSGCDWLQLEMVWALDYLGANPQCVIQHYEWRASLASRPGVTDGWNNGGLIELYGWHRCATVIDPIQPDGRLLSDHGLTMAERCRAVLPADVKLEERTSTANRGVFRHWMTCDEWGEWVEYRRTGYPGCENSARLAEEWLEHHHGMPENFWRISC